jgi:hypothetical protein
MPDLMGNGIHNLLGYLHFLPRMNKQSIAGWIIVLAGSALWIYGYFVAGHASLVDWRAISPSWVADFLPNIEAEIGLVLSIVGLVPLYWPDRS